MTRPTATPDTLRLVPHGQPCVLHDCPPGPFVWLEGDGSGRLGFATAGVDEYGPVAFSETGERVPMALWGLRLVRPLRQSTTDEGG